MASRIVFSASASYNKKLAAIAKELQLTKSDVLRRLIDKKYEELFGDLDEDAINFILDRR